ncbi:hypothetical protein [Acidovorax cavernicola]|uniref:Uncharacterized protein n=1 Tax=Acidovorax cavernicola TaxID=1675792 RepID=A0A9X8D4Z8_9BURK|nr:hypothetical protein [Acidovorax cavernicola]RIX79871.1 hypothetical protein D3H34_13510 [Acidovorax cavernicola]
MRDDMDKVIVERPRGGRRVQGDGRVWRNSPERGSHLGMKRGLGSPKWLSENLQPLKRWLHKQVHRPWDKVYAELCSGIDRRSTVQAHIFQHIGDFVARDTVLCDGEVRVPPYRWGDARRVPLHEAPGVELFVHPVTGILLPNRRLRQARAARASKRFNWAEQRGDTPYAVYHVIDETTQWHRVDGCWFEVVLAKFPERADTAQPEPKCYDVLRRCVVTRGGAAQRPAPGLPTHFGMYGRYGVYAAAKRQLSRREVRARLGDAA